MNKNWLTDGWLDQEYKQYLFLAWMQQIKQEFQATRLYPALSDLISTHQQLTQLTKEQSAMESRAKGGLKRIDLRAMRMEYEALQQHPELDGYLRDLIDFALPKLDKAIADGKEIYELVEDSLGFEPVGLLPLYRAEGYLFIHNEGSKEVCTYRYHKSRIKLASEYFAQLALELIDRSKKSFHETFASMKIHLTRRYSDLPNPATYLLHTPLSFPLEETVLPIARRKLLLALHEDRAA